MIDADPRDEVIVVIEQLRRGGGLQRAAVAVARGLVAVELAQEGFR